MSSNVSSAQLLILVEAERTAGGKYDDWRDITGERYHYPNVYKNKIVTGKSFLYYRGIRTRTGRRDQPEYFGLGRIGLITRDPEIPEDAPRRTWKWFCEIEEYVPFALPIQWKRADGTLYEDIPHNLFSNGVRDVPVAVFQEITSAAGVGMVEYQEVVNHEGLRSTAPNPQLVPSHSPIFIPIPHSNQYHRFTRRRTSRRENYVRQRAEEAVQIHLHDACGLSEREFRRSMNASDSQREGLEIGQEDCEVIIGIKGTAASKFTHVEFTPGEWNAAQQYGQRFHLYLVADCLSGEPRIQRIVNPASLHREGKLRVEPALLRISLES